MGHNVTQWDTGGKKPYENLWLVPDFNSICRQLRTSLIYHRFSPSGTQFYFMYLDGCSAKASCDVSGCIPTSINLCEMVPSRSVCPHLNSCISGLGAVPKALANR